MLSERWVSPVDILNQVSKQISLGSGVASLLLLTVDRILMSGLN